MDRRRSRGLRGEKVEITAPEGERPGLEGGQLEIDDLVAEDGGAALVDLGEVGVGDAGAEAEEAGVARAYAETAVELGGVDIVVSNAGIASSAGTGSGRAVPTWATFSDSTLIDAASRHHIAALVTAAVAGDDDEMRSFIAANCGP